MKLKLFALLALSLQVAGCASTASSQLPRLWARVDVQGAQVGLTHMPRPRVQMLHIEADRSASTNGASTSQSELSKAIVCNAEKTECKHAVVRPIVRSSLVQTSSETAKLVGSFDVAVGRALTDVAGNTQSIDDSVELIEEGKFSYPFDTELHVGQPFTVAGRLGTRVTFTLEPRP
jgi:hypothetical protein